MPRLLLRTVPLVAVMALAGPGAAQPAAHPTHARVAPSSADAGPADGGSDARSPTGRAGDGGRAIVEAGAPDAGEERLDVLGSDASSPYADELLHDLPPPEKADDLVITTPAHRTAPEAPRTAETDVVVRTIVGLALLVFLAYVAALPAVHRLEQRLGISHLITSGFPFVLLGLAAHALGISSRETMLSLTPLLHFGLGWIGFLLGFRFDVRFLDRVPEGTALAVTISAGIPFVGISIATWLCLVAFGGAPDDPALIRDALALGIAGSITAPRVATAWAAEPATAQPADDLPRRIGQLDEIAAVVGLAFLASYVRPADVALTWDLTGTAWLFLTLGMGVAIGVVLFAALSLRSRATEFLALSIGSVAFAAGFAGFLHLSPVVVCFLAGTLATNLPFRYKADLAELLTRFERPIWLIFLAMAGGLWDPRDWRGWLLVPVFVLARVIAKGAALLALRAKVTRALPISGEHRFVFSRVSVISIAIIISVQSLYRGQTVSWIVTAVLGAAAVSEIMVQLVRRGRAATEAEGR